MANGGCITSASKRGVSKNERQSNRRNRWLCVPRCAHRALLAHSGMRALLRAALARTRAACIPRRITRAAPPALLQQRTRAATTYPRRTAAANDVAGVAAAQRGISGGENKAKKIMAGARMASAAHHETSALAWCASWQYRQ
jgi:hypothetical protein